MTAGKGASTGAAGKDGVSLRTRLIAAQSRPATSQTTGPDCEFQNIISVNAWVSIAASAAKSTIRKVRSGPGGARRYVRIAAQIRVPQMKRKAASPGRPT